MPKLTPQSASTLVSLFRRFGFSLCKRGSDDHIRMQKAGVSRPLVFPDKRAVPVFIILNDLRVAGISREDYFRVLGEL